VHFDAVTSVEVDKAIVLIAGAGRIESLVPECASRVGNAFDFRSGPMH
jgi:hypothetical protein